MTRYEKWMQMSVEELSEELCNVIDKSSTGCGLCVANEYCRFGHKGTLDYLNEEVEDGNS